MLRFSISILLLITFQIVKGQLEIVDSTDFKDGNGTLIFKDSLGNKFGFLSFKNGHMDGKYFWIDSSGTFSITGTLKYSPTCFPPPIGYQVTYVTNTNDTLSSVYDSSFLERFCRTAPIRIINIGRTPIPLISMRVHPDLQMNFGDPDVVPIGKWEYRDVISKHVFKEYVFDNCGNILTTRLFNYKGDIMREIHYKQSRHNKINW